MAQGGEAQRQANVSPSFARRLGVRAAEIVRQLIVRHVCLSPSPRGYWPRFATTGKEQRDVCKPQRPATSARRELDRSFRRKIQHHLNVTALRRA